MTRSNLERSASNVVNLFQRAHEQETNSMGGTDGSAAAGLPSAAFQNGSSQLTTSNSLNSSNAHTARELFGGYGSTSAGGPEPASSPVGAEHSPSPANPAYTVLNTVMLYSADADQMNPDIINNDLVTANQVYNSHGIEIRQGKHQNLTREATARVMGSDGILKMSDNDAKGGPEVSKLLAINAKSARNELTAYWVPSLNPATLRGQSYRERGACLINTPERQPDTLAHELGHLFGIEGHVVSAKIQDAWQNKNVSFDPEQPTDAKVQKNLMAAGAVRITDAHDSDQLSETQLALIRQSPFLQKGSR